MMPHNAVTILKQYQDARYSPGGDVTMLMKVSFMVGKNGPFLEEFPLVGFTATARDARLRELGEHYWTEPPSTA